MASLDHRLNPLFSIKECMTCGALYTADFCCSKGGLEDKILVPKPPQNCATCGNPVDGLYCRHCVFVRKCLNEGWYTIHDENEILNTSKSSKHNTNVVSTPQEPFIFNQDPGENSSQSPLQINQNCCYKCGDLLDGIFCQQCTCKSCGNGAHIGYNCPPKAPIISNPEQCNQTINELPQTLPSVHPTCNYEDENSFTYDSKPNSFNDSPSVLTHPPQLQFETYLCELCGNNAHYGYDCPPQFPLVYEQEPCYNQNFNDNYFPQNSQSSSQQYLCCENCGGPHETFQCQPMNEDYYEQNSCYDPNSFGFDQYQPPQFPVNYPPQETSREILQAQEDLMEAIQAFLKEYDHIPPNEKCMALLLAEERFLKIKQTMREEQNQPEVMQELLLKLMDDLQTLKGSQQEKKETAAQGFIPYWNSSMIDDEEARDNFLKDVCTFLRKFSRIPFGITPKVILIAWERFGEIKDALMDKQYRQKDIQDLMSKLLEDYTVIWRRPKAITPDEPSEEPEDSLIMGDEHLDTIPEKESDELIKSSVENLVPIPSESEDFSDNESECDVPECDETSPTFTTFSNPLFDSNDDFTSSDDESLSDEDVPMENFKIYSNPLFDDEEIISTKIDPHSFNAESNLIESLLNRDTLIDSSPKFDFLFEEFSGELAHIDPIPPRIEKADFDLEEEIRLVENLLYDNSSPRPPEELNLEIADTIFKSLSPSPILVEDSDSLMEEIDLFLASNDLMPPGIEDDDYDSERDICFLEEFLNNNSLFLPENESSNLDHFNDPSFPRPPPEPPDVEISLIFEPNVPMVNIVDELNEEECFNPGGEIDFSQNDRDYDSFTFVTWIFLPYLTYPKVSPLLSSARNEDTIFDPGIST
ncbi:hypothetical protein Tco_0285100 [Tanacetum coccineum]